MVRPIFWKSPQLLLLLFLSGSTSASDESISTGSSQLRSCDASDYDSATGTGTGTGTCRHPDQLETNTKPPCPADIKDEDVEYCMQQAFLGKCSLASEESEILKKRCPKACRTCWSCDNVRGDEECEGNYPGCYNGQLCDTGQLI
jgi:hypothetical protein